MKKLVGVALLGMLAGWLTPPTFAAASSSETAALDRVASILDKLLDAVKDDSRRSSQVECVCRCDK